MAYRQSQMHRGQLNRVLLDEVEVDYTRLRLADAVDSDDSLSVLSAVTDDDNGLTVELAGSVDSYTADPLNGAWWTWKLTDILGREFDDFADDAWQAMVQLAFSILPDVADDTYAILGVCNASDLRSGSAQGWGIVVHASGATIEVQGIRFTASTASIGGGPGTWAATNTRFHCSVQRGAGNTEGVACVSLDDDGGNDQLAVKRGGSAGAQAGDGLHGFLVVGRSDAANTNAITVRFRPWSSIMPNPTGGFLPTES